MTKTRIDAADLYVTRVQELGDRVAELETRLEQTKRERDEWMLRCRQLVDAVDAIRPELDSLLKAELHSARERDR